jgi:hypothetical protein
MSKGSLTELIDQSIVAHDENYINTEEYNEIRKLIETALRLLNGYTNYLNTAISKTGKVSDAEVEYCTSKYRDMTNN